MVLMVVIFNLNLGDIDKKECRDAIPFSSIDLSFYSFLSISQDICKALSSRSTPFMYSGGIDIVCFPTAQPPLKILESPKRDASIGDKPEFGVRSGDSFYNINTNLLASPSILESPIGGIDLGVTT